MLYDIISVAAFLCLETTHATKNESVDSRAAYIQMIIFENNNMDLSNEIIDALSIYTSSK